MNHKLFERYELGTISLPNRVVMAPMTRCRALNNVPNELMAEYYGQRAAAGLIITEGIAPSSNGLGYARIPGLFSKEQIQGWRRVTQAVHDKGGRIFAQLMHAGRIGHPHNLPPGAELVAPSAIAAKGEMWTDLDGMQPHPAPREMTLADVRATQKEYEQAAVNALEAGFDGVELHGANGYLIEQFLNPTVNQRTDDYGGTAEKRARFVVEMLERISLAIGPDHLGLRLSPHGVFNDMGTYDGVEEQYVIVARAAAKHSLAYLHALRGAHVAPETLSAIRSEFGGTFILNGGYDAEQAKADIDAGKAELISFGSKFLANPDLIARLESGAALNPPNPATFYSAGPEGYTDYATLSA